MKPTHVEFETASGTKIRTTCAAEDTGLAFHYRNKKKVYTAEQIVKATLLGKKTVIRSDVVNIAIPVGKKMVYDFVVRKPDTPSSIILSNNVIYVMD